MRCQESDRGTVLWNGVGTKGSGSSPASDDADLAQKAGRRGKAPCCVAASRVEQRVSTWRKCGQVRVLGSFVWMTLAYAIPASLRQACPSTRQRSRSNPARPYI